MRILFYITLCLVQAVLPSLCAAGIVEHHCDCPAANCQHELQCESDPCQLSITRFESKISGTALVPAPQLLPIVLALAPQPLRYFDNAIPNPNVPTLVSAHSLAYASGEFPLLI